MLVTASKIYDYLTCPHKVWRDIYGPQDEKIIEPNPFIKLLWEKGVLHEQKILENLGEYIDLSQGDLEDRIGQTLFHMKKGSPLIYQGVLRKGNLLGIPDILKKTGPGQYMPIDIKSGRATESGNDQDQGRPKQHYALQLCLYADLLHELGLGENSQAAIIDIDGRQVNYDLYQDLGGYNWMAQYRKVRSELELLMEGKIQNKPALGGSCRLCPWYNSCRDWCYKNDDLSLIFYLGRSKRDVLNQDLGVYSIADICNLDLKQVLNRKKSSKGFLKGVGKETLEKIIIRARLIKEGIHRIHNQLEFPQVPVELFLDIEDDPTQDFIYLHGVYERKQNTERFVSFIATDNTPQEEEKAWQDLLNYIRSYQLGNYSLYYYSAHEKTSYNRLLKKYPRVISQKQLDEIFDHPYTIDLYNVIYSSTDWPLWSYSLKDIATYIGFEWRDRTPSGALSIQWYNKYLETRNETILNRITQYNEDDCKATMTIKDFLENDGR